MAAQWARPIATAPGGRRVLVYGQGGWQIAIRDAEGQWRRQFGGPLHLEPKWWAPLPPAPIQDVAATPPSRATGCEGEKTKEFP